MADPAETAALIALLRIGKRPWSLYTELVEEAGSATAVLAAELAGSAQSEGPPHEPQQLFDAEPRQPGGVEGTSALLEGVTAELAAWSAEGITVQTVLDQDYPDNLRAVHDRPPLVFVAGTVVPDHAKGVAVVGARMASDAGIASAIAIARHLVESGYTVISGLAAGIDTAAHKTALARAGRTVAVIGTGLRRVYPQENRVLQHRIADQHAVISQFWPDAPPSKRSFPMRNAVMSGIALATVVVEASQTSGSRIQARLALEQGRPVFLWHSLLEHEWARAFAERPGAHVVRTAAEITTVVERLTSPGTLVA